MKTFTDALDSHLKAIIERDIDSFKRFISDKVPPVLILPNGKIIRGSEEILNFHKNWFQDLNWNMTFDIIDTMVMQDSAYALLQYTYQKKSENGESQTSQSYLSLLFTLTQNGWILIRDQNTDISC